MTSPVLGDDLRPRFTRSPYLVGLIADAERLAALVAGADPDADEVTAIVEEARLATLRLDGSAIVEVPDAAAERTAPASAAPAGRQVGTWLDALRVGEAPDAEVLAAEYLGVRAGLEADDLAEGLLTEPQVALPELHRRLTRGLLADGHGGIPRATRQAVHDGSTGRILYHTAEPAHVPGRLGLLGGWLVSAAAREHALIVSGVVHHELLDIHPFEAANGRLARTAARLILRRRALDPHGLAAPEPVLERDPLAYHEEVARTVHRRDLTVWLERWGEVVTAGLRASARRLGLLGDEVDRRPAGFLDRWPEPAFTIADYRAEAPAGPEEARRDLDQLLDAGRVRRTLGARGLRYEVVHPAAAEPEPSD